MEQVPMGTMPELLAPAGGPDALAAALAAGADAVYLGLGTFNARAANSGFDLASLVRGCALAHAHGARVYVTLNAFVRDAELAGAVELGLAAIDAGADALIVADAGLCRALTRERPGVELHLSTQAGAMSASAVRLAVRELGVSRVTCARELSLAELSELAATGVPIEAFCHGAICICYSGACSYSAVRRGRSAMRGDCTQPCRMAYELQDDQGTVLAGGSWRSAREEGDGRAAVGDRLLCPRDYLGIRLLPALVASGVASLKIEGRMKNPDYVYNVVRTYRAALDVLATGAIPDFDALEEQLARSFNRGFTDGYLRGGHAGTGRSLMSFERAINQGLRVGRVVERRHEEIVVAFDRAVSEGDTLEIRSTPALDAPADVPKRWPMIPCPRGAAPLERVAMRCKRVVEPGSAVHLVRSPALIAEAARAVEELRCDGEGACAEGAGADGAGLADARRAADEMTGALPASPADRPAIECAPAPALPAGPIVAAWRLLDADPEGALDLSAATVVLDEACRAADEPRVRDLCARAAAVVCRNLGEVELARAAGVPWGAAPPLAVWNAACAQWLRGLGASWVWVAEEVGSALRGADGVWDPAASGAPLAATPLMITEHCLLTAEGPCDHACERCERRAQAARGGRVLVELDRGSAHGRLPVVIDAHGRTRIFNEGVRVDA